MKTERITSIDALRAVVLLGILMVHASVLFSFINGTNIFDFSIIGRTLTNVIGELLQFRCNKIFGMLFGVSFYLILRNPMYSPYKFVWRCILLMGIGLFNKIFYTVDALMWYGFWGIILVLFRNLPCKYLLLCFCGVFVLSSISIDSGFFKIASNHLPLARYDLPTSLERIVRYPILSTVKDYVTVVSWDPFSCLWQFLIGYYFAKKGIIENIKKYVSMKNILLFGMIYILLFIVIRVSHIHIGLLQNGTWLSGAIFYSLLFLKLYYRFYPKLRSLEAYGKLGLTNYTFQGVWGVILSLMIYIPNHWSIEFVYLFSILFFICQLIFSNIWLKYFTNGPLEWAWRCLTNMKFVNPLIQRK